MRLDIRSDKCLPGSRAMPRQVVVVDYGIGNVFSVCNALSRIGASPVLSGDSAIITKAERVILPGVGAFSKAMDNLRSQGLDDATAKFIDTGRPFLGICIGMQVLMERSTELGEHAGLGYIKGSVEMIPNISLQGDCLKVPHVGWAKVNNYSTLSHQTAVRPSDRDRYFYFVHSFMCKPSIEENLLATVSYHGRKITAMVGRDNILGVQFHPERSGPSGLTFLKEFCFNN